MKWSGCKGEILTYKNCTRMYHPSSILHCGIHPWVWHSADNNSPRLTVVCGVSDPTGWYFCSSMRLASLEGERSVTRPHGWFRKLTAQKYQRWRQTGLKAGLNSFCQSTMIEIHRQVLYLTVTFLLEWKWPNGLRMLKAVKPRTGHTSLKPGGNFLCRTSYF